MMPTHRSPLLGCMALALMMGSADAKKPPAAPGPAAAVSAPAPAPAAKSLPPPADPPSSPDAASAAPPSPPEAAAAAAPPAAVTAAPQTPPIPNLTPEELAVARQHFEAGTQAFEDKRYEVALNEFTTSFEISKEPDLLYNLHRVAIRLGQKDMAVNYLRQYLEYRPADSAKIQTEIDQINAQPLAPPTPPAPPPRVAATAADTGSAAPRWPGVVLMVFGGASAATGVALLAATGALPTDIATDKVRSNSLLGAGGFLLGTGVVELIGGAVLYVKRRPRAQTALVPTSAGLQLVGLY